MQGSRLWRQIVDLVNINQGPHLLSHEESQPTDSVFKQQRFLEREESKTVRMRRSSWDMADISLFLRLAADDSHLWLSELSEAGCQAVVIDVAVGLYRHIQDMDRLVLDTLDDKANPHYHSKENSHTGRWLSEVCSPHLVVLFTIQDRITSLWEGWTWGRGVGEAAQHVCYVPGEEKSHTCHYRACNIISAYRQNIFELKSYFYTWTDLVNSWKERNATMAPMRWQGGVKDVSSRTSLTLATCTMP